MRPSALSIVRATLMLGLVALSSGSASAQQTQAGVTEEMAERKGTMLRSFLGSTSFRAALDESPDLVAPLSEEARLKLEAGLLALKQGRVSDAASFFDAGMRAASRAMAMAPGKSRHKGDKRSSLFLKQVETYLGAIEASDELSGDERAEAAELRARFETLRGEDASSAAVADLYRDTVKLVTRLQSGRTVFVRREFASAEDEYRYEFERARSYKLLVELVKAERSAAGVAVGPRVTELETAADGGMAHAEQLAAEGNYPEAIQVLEDATNRFIVALRAAGMMLMQ